MNDKIASKENFTSMFRENVNYKLKQLDLFIFFESIYSIHSYLLKARYHSIYRALSKRKKKVD